MATKIETASDGVHGAPENDTVHRATGVTVVLRGVTYPVVEIPVAMLGLARDKVREISEEAVAELAEKDEKRWAALVVRAWPADWEKPTPQVEYHVMCGNHRTRAAQIKPLDTLPAIIVEASTELEWWEIAYEDNAGHGRNYTSSENEASAKRFAKLGKTATEIAKIMGYNRSTVSRWLSGADAHAAEKQQREVVKHFTDGTYTLSLPQGIGADATKQKVLGLITTGRIAVSVEEARTYIATLKSTQRASLSQLQDWLTEVLDA